MTGKEKNRLCHKILALTIFKGIVYVAYLHQVSNGSSKDGNMKGLSICFHMVKMDGGDMMPYFIYLFFMQSRVSMRNGQMRVSRVLLVVGMLHH